MSRLTEQWPDRPEGFYEDWKVFVAAALSEYASRSSSALATVIMAGGATAGVGTVLAIIRANKEAIDRVGEDIGLPSLYALVSVAGVATGGLGGALITRAMKESVDDAAVRRFDSRLELAQREFETALRDLAQGLLDPDHHRLTVERVYSEVVS